MSNKTRGTVGSVAHDTRVHAAHEDLRWVVHGTLEVTHKVPGGTIGALVR